MTLPRIRLTMSAILIAGSLLLGAMPAESATQRIPEPTVVTDVSNSAGRMVAPMTWPYSAIEVTRYWNVTHGPNITLAQGAYLAAYYNAAVSQALGQYLLAVYLNALPDHRTCSGPGDCDDLIRSVFSARGLDSSAAVRVASCESGLNPNARNPSGASGLFQHLISLWPARAAGAGYPGASPFNPYVNTLAAANMVAASGWSAWVCRP